MSKISRTKHEHCRRGFLHEDGDDIPVKSTPSWKKWSSTWEVQPFVKSSNFYLKFTLLLFSRLSLLEVCFRFLRMLYFLIFFKLLNDRRGQTAFGEIHQPSELILHAVACMALLRHYYLWTFLGTIIIVLFLLTSWALALQPASTSLKGCMSFWRLLNKVNYAAHCREQCASRLCAGTINHRCWQVTADVIFNIAFSLFSVA